MKLVQSGEWEFTPGWDGQNRLRELWPLVQGHAEGPVTVPLALNSAPWFWTMSVSDRDVSGAVNTGWACGNPCLTRGECMGSQAMRVQIPGEGVACEPLAGLSWVPLWRLSDC